MITRILFALTQRLVLGACLIALAAPLTGCMRAKITEEQKRHAVKVTVNVDGKPVENGRVIFHSKDGQAPGIGEVKNGFAEFKCGAGKCHVEIFAFREVPRHREPQNFLPARYNERSELSAEVVAGTVNTFNFDVKSN
jgi:hypothetical protein